MSAGPIHLQIIVHKCGSKKKLKYIKAVRNRKKNPYPVYQYKPTSINKHVLCSNILSGKEINTVVFAVYVPMKLPRKVRTKLIKSYLVDLFHKNYILL